MNFSQFLESLKNLNSKTIAGPIIIVMLLAMMILPIPAIGLDLLLHSILHSPS